MRPVAIQEKRRRQRHRLPVHEQVAMDDRPQESLLAAGVHHRDGAAVRPRARAPPPPRRRAQWPARPHPPYRDEGGRLPERPRASRAAAASLRQNSRTAGRPFNAAIDCVEPSMAVAVKAGTGNGS